MLLPLWGATTATVRVVESRVGFFFLIFNFIRTVDQDQRPVDPEPRPKILILLVLGLFLRARASSSVLGRLGMFSAGITRITCAGRSRNYHGDGTSGFWSGAVYSRSCQIERLPVSWRLQVGAPFRSSRPCRGRDRLITLKASPSILRILDLLLLWKTC